MPSYRTMLALGATALALAGCETTTAAEVAAGEVAAPAPSPAPSAEAPSAFPADLVMLGRYDEMDTGARRIGWVGSGFTLAADGAVTVTMTDSGGNRFDVTEGDASRILTPQAGTHDYVLGADGTRQTITLRRRSESISSGLTTIDAVEAATTGPPVLPDRRILFLGDSITAGFGVTGPNETCGYDVDTSSVQDTYAVMAADAFGADYHVVAISGRGAIYNYDDAPRPNMAAHVTMALPDTPGTWDEGLWTPDLIVINLGTNDWSTYDPGTTFAGNYTGILTELAGTYPDATILSLTGPLLEGDQERAIEDGVAEAITRAAGIGVDARALALTLPSEGDIYGCSRHPNVRAMRHMADTLIPEVEALMGWTTQ